MSAMHRRVGGAHRSGSEAGVPAPPEHVSVRVWRLRLLLVGVLVAAMQCLVGCRVWVGSGQKSLVGGEALGLTSNVSYAVQQSLRKGALSLTDADLARVESLHELPVEVTDEDLACLARLPALQSVTLGRPRVTARGLAALARLPSLRMLTLDEWDQPADGYRWIGRLRRLEGLHLKACAGVTDDVMRDVARLPHLRGLGIEAHLVGPEGI